MPGVLCWRVCNVVSSPCRTVRVSGLADWWRDSFPPRQHRPPGLQCAHHTIRAGGVQRGGKFGLPDVLSDWYAAEVERVRARVHD